MAQEVRNQRVRSVQTMQSHIFIRKNWTYGSQLLCYDTALRDYVSARVIGVGGTDGDSLRIETILKNQRLERVVRRDAFYLLPKPSDVHTVLANGWFVFHDALF